MLKQVYFFITKNKQDRQAFQKDLGKIGKKDKKCSVWTLANDNTWFITV